MNVMSSRCDIDFQDNLSLHSQIDNHIKDKSEGDSDQFMHHEETNLPLRQIMVKCNFIHLSDCIRCISKLGDDLENIHVCRSAMHMI